MSVKAIEKRSAARFPIRCIGEMASGTALVQVHVRDMSLTGCGIEILDRGHGQADTFGATGLISLEPPGCRYGLAILPVMLCDMRIEDDRICYGLMFRRPTARQTRKLIALLDTLIEE